MKNPRLSIFSLLLCAVIVGCADMPPIPIGATEADLINARGNPTHRHPVNNQQLLEYKYGPSGQQSYMVRLDASGKVVSVEQALTDQKFRQITLGASRKTEVLHTIGSPVEQGYMPLTGLEVWSYLYLDSGIWNFIMHVSFDTAGIVRKMEKAPDLNYVGQPGNLFGTAPF